MMKKNDTLGGNEIHILLANIYEKSMKVTQNKIFCTICQSAIKSARTISNRHTLTDQKRIFTGLLVLLACCRSYTIVEGVNCHSEDLSTVSALHSRKQLPKLKSDLTH